MPPPFDMSPIGLVHIVGSKEYDPKIPLPLMDMFESRLLIVDNDGRFVRIDPDYYTVKKCDATFGCTEENCEFMQLYVQDKVSH